MRRALMRRHDDRCPIPGCANQIFLEDAHVIPHRDTACREAFNFHRLCSRHHRMFDQGLIRDIGTVDDPFWVDLGSIFDLLALRPLQSLHLINQPGNTKGVDGLKGYNVMSIVLQVPITDVVQSQSNQIIGVWSTSSRSHVTVRSTGLTPIQALSAPVSLDGRLVTLVEVIEIRLYQCGFDRGHIFWIDVEI